MLILMIVIMMTASVMIQTAVAIMVSSADSAGEGANGENTH